jgi:hypothetical protein
MATKFKIKYYETHLNERQESYPKIMEDTITARFMELHGDKVIFYDNGMGKVVKAIFSDFISVKEI